MAQKIREDRIIWPKSPSGRPRHKKFMFELDSEFTGFSSLIECGNTNEGTEEVADIMGSQPFIFPKPRSLFQTLLEQATEKDSLILDSFAGSGTTGHAVLSLNKQDGGNRRFILIEMEPKIARAVTVERVRRVAQGYRNTKGERVKGLGGGFRFCELGEPLFDENGKIREAVSFGALARHVYFTETGEPLPRERVSKKTPLLGITSNGVAVYLLYNGILNDKSVAGGNVLTSATMALLPAHTGPQVVYAAGCRFSPARLKREGIVFKQIPYAIQMQ
jgi:site-specific DNA-methyltransferase (adenine-specific)/adenine-specific DNA-methyltransferase